MDEGYVKYISRWTQEPLVVDSVALEKMNRVREQLIAWDMIGKIPDGPGFGNISWRNTDNNFIISGTNTGHINLLEGHHMALVYRVAPSENTVWCKGETQASSESMSHYAIYEKLPHTKGVIHIHHKELWENYKYKMPTTHADIPYGTPQMAALIQEMLPEMKDDDVLVLGGHEDGIISFGKSLDEAMLKIEKLFLPELKKQGKKFGR